MGGLLDLEKHFVFYGTYHSNPVNIFIHVLFVWPIFFSFQLLFYFTPPLFHVSSTLGLPLVFNFGFAVVLTYSIFYILLERRTGSLAALLCILCWVGSSVLGSRLGFSRTWKVTDSRVLTAEILLHFFCVLVIKITGFMGYEH